MTPVKTSRNRSKATSMLAPTAATPAKGETPRKFPTCTAGPTLASCLFMDWICLEMSPDMIKFVINEKLSVSRYFSSPFWVYVRSYRNASDG